MQVNQLIKVKKSIEKFFYKMRYNVGLEALFSSPTYEDFRGKVEKALEDQMLYYAKFEKVNNIIGLQKNHYESKDTQLKSNIKKLWLPILAILDEEYLEEYYKYVANSAGQTMLDSATTGADFELTNTPLTKKVLSRVKEFTSVVDNTTQDWLTRRVEQGLVNKMNAFDIAKMLRDDAPDVAFERSITIAEQETALVYGAMVLEVLKRNRIEKVKWVTAKDERTCPICMGNEGVGIIKVGKKFPSEVTNPPAHINCRCFILPVQDKETEAKWLGE